MPTHQTSVGLCIGVFVVLACDGDATQFSFAALDKTSACVRAAINGNTENGDWRSK